jgi:hypothetical protein
MLNSITYETACLRAGSLGLDTQLNEIRRLLLPRTYGGVINFNGSPIIEPQGMASYFPQSHALPAGLPARMSDSGAELDSSIYTRNLSEEGTRACWTEGHSPDSAVTRTKSFGITTSRPMSILERSPKFSPAGYTADSPAPSIIITSSWQMTESQSSRKNLYHIFFSSTANVYHQLTVSVDIPRSSRYWATTKVPRQQFKCRDYMFLVSTVSLPQSLQDEIWHILVRKTSVAEQAHLELTLHPESENTSETSPKPPCQVFSSLHVRPQSVFNDSDMILRSLEDLGCPLYDEREVHTLATLEPPNRFIAMINGSLVQEVKCIRPRPNLNFVYSIQAFHCTREMPGILNLKGVVIDSSRRYLRSYLLELPATRCSLLLDHLSDFSHTCWEEREACARRLIDTVRQVHSKSYVVGTLQRTALPVLVDSFGNLYLSRLDQTPISGDFQEVTYPPEFRQYLRAQDHTTPETEAPRITPKFDIYQLGSVLWVLAQSWALGQPASSVRLQFDALSTRSETSGQHRMLNLPPLEDKVPTYYREMVEACRCTDPPGRPSATKLLSLMPKADERDLSHTEIHPPIDVLSYQKCVVAARGCDICRAAIKGGVFYHCNTCASGDYDVCKNCLASGRHCYEEGHFLVELEYSCKCPVARRYFSCVKTSGERDVIEV